MRCWILVMIVVLITACSSKSVPENKAMVTKFGLITAKEEVDLDQVNKESKTKTNVYASFSSGGRVSIGIGFLVGLFDSDEVPETPIRYEVGLLDDSEITIYHLSQHFEIGDCVVITMHEDIDENPPSMERSKDGC